MRIPDEITNTDDLIDGRDVIQRIHWIEIDDATDRDPDEQEELDRLYALQDGVGGERVLLEGVTLINDRYFEDYARQYAEDLGLVDVSGLWPASYIDWPAAAEALQDDYAEVDFDGVTYWFRE